MFGRRAADLCKEVASCRPENIPPYNDEQVRLALEEVRVHSTFISTLFQCDSMPSWEVTAQRVKKGHLDEAPEDSEAADWEDHPLELAALVTHHAAIVRNKRLLLAYHSARLDSIRALRWQQRSLPPSVRDNLSPAEQQLFKDYDRLLSSFMRRGEHGVGMDLTLDMLPPKEPDVAVRVLRDYGDVVLSVGPVLLASGSVHLVPREEAEHLIREGIVEEVELERD